MFWCHINNKIILLYYKLIRYKWVWYLKSRWCRVNVPDVVTTEFYA